MDVSWRGKTRPGNEGRKKQQGQRLIPSPLAHLGDAGDDVRIFAGVVFLVAAEHSNLAALQNVNLQDR